MLAVDMVRSGALRFADRIAVRCDGDSLTYGDVDTAANRFANWLVGQEIPPGTRVGMLVANQLWTVSLNFAWMKARLVRVPLNARLAVDEHIAMLRDAGVDYLVYESAQTSRAVEIADRMPELHLIAVGPGVSSPASTWTRSRGTG